MSEVQHETHSRDLDKTIVRLPDGMRSQIKAAARANKRSANAEIVSRLEASFVVAGQELNGPIAAILAAYVEGEVRRRLQEIASKIGGAA